MYPKSEGRPLEGFLTQLKGFEGTALEDFRETKYSVWAVYMGYTFASGYVGAFFLGLGCDRRGRRKKNKSRSRKASKRRKAGVPQVPLGVLFQYFAAPPDKNLLWLFVRGGLDRANKVRQKRVKHSHGLRPPLLRKVVCNGDDGLLCYLRALMVRSYVVPGRLRRKCL